MSKRVTESLACLASCAIAIVMGILIGIGWL